MDSWKIVSVMESLYLWVPVCAAVCGRMECNERRSYSVKERGEEKVEFEKKLPRNKNRRQLSLKWPFKTFFCPKNLATL